MRKSLFVFASLILLSLSCKKNISAGKEVEIYLLKTYQPVAGKCQVDVGTAILQDTPAIRNDDIIAYSKTEYTFELTNRGIVKINTFKDRDAFAVTVDKQVIYYGYFKPPISSSSCDHSITMNNGPGSNKISLQLGYPGGLSGITIDDQRNSPKLIATLSAQGKLR